ncbi:MAG: chemotaxis protein CheB [Mucilaginibacter sp.]|nr:chemotaxis protein CheB [Mucilaginibacter sp.]
MNEDDFYIIGIGSSAGGLEPLQTIVRGLAGDINAALIVVQHIPVDYASNLDQILQRLTPLNLIPVETIEYVEPGNLYVMHVGKQMILKDRFLSIEERNGDEPTNRTIDRCFESIAKEAGTKAIGVILSGAGFDGLEGAKAIEDNQGLVIVQDPITADFPLMPQNLIANDHPDAILSPENILKKINDHISGQQKAT